LNCGRGRVGLGEVLAGLGEWGLNIINRFVMIISRRIWSAWRGGSQLRFGLALLRFPLPDLGEKIKEGKVKKLYIKEGDHIKEF
jgi:hypothetical protein